MRQLYRCNTCKVNYDGEKEYLHSLTFDCKIKDVPYELTIDSDKNQTILAAWTEPDCLTYIMDISLAIKHVTPQNVEDKIKTLLTFS